MTVPDQTPQNVHTANGVSTTFAYQFKILDTDHLEVYLDDVLQTSGYTVTGEGVNAGGTVVFTTAPANGTEVILMRSMTIERTAYDYQNAGDFLAATVNEDFDAAIMIAQQINHKVDQRALLFPATLDRTNNTNALPEPQEGRVLYWSNGELQNALLSSLATNPTFASELRTFTTMAQAIADATLEETNILFVSGRGNSFWSLSASGTANTYDVVYLTASGLYATIIPGESTDLKAFGIAGTDADYTAGIAAAIAATVNKKLLWSAGTYQSDSIVVPPNVHWVFDKNCTLKATTGYGSTDELLDFTGASDVVLECNDAIFQMIKSEYATGEHRHCFNLVNCTDVLIINPNAIDSGGDGYYVNGATRCTIVNPKADNNRRNGMSVIKATDLNVVGLAKFSDQTGTAPQSGLVIEPNSDADSLIRVNFDTVEVTGNAADGCSIYLDDYKTGAPADVSININKLISRGNAGRALRISNVFLNSGSYGGTINIGEIISDDDVKSAVSIADKGVSAPFLNIGKVTAWNPCTGSSTFQDTAAVYLEDTSATVSGGMHIGPISARATHTDMDYGVIAEMGGGFSDTRILIENVRGQQVTPVRLNNITSTIAEASDMIVQMDKLMETVALTTGTNIVATAHLGRIITNAGAVGSITLALREYPPAGNPYRFRVEAAQTIAIDTFDAADRIVGTTTAGATVTSNVVGAECEVYYLGTFGGVRYWKHNPIGPAASWTYN